MLNYIVYVFNLINYYYDIFNHLVSLNFYLTSFFTGMFETEFMLIVLSGKKQNTLALFAIVVSVSFVYNILLFLLSKYYIKNYINKHFLQYKLKIIDLIDHHQNLILITMKFIPLIPFGKSVIPLIFGTLDIEFAKYSKFSFIASLLWCSIYISIGYVLQVDAFYKLLMIKFLIFSVLFVLSYFFIKEQ